MSDEKPSDDVYESMLHEHANLRRLLEEIQQMFTDKGAIRSDVVERTAHLQSVIEDHFRTEELSGCFGEMVSQAPRFSAQIEQLIVDHGELSKEVAQLAKQAAQCAEQEVPWEELGRCYHAFRERLLQHESQENELLQAVFTEDLGSKD